MPKQGDQREFLKLSRLEKFYKWVGKDPAEDLLPMLTIGIFSVVIGVIMIALTLGTDDNLVIVGTAMSIVGSCVVAIALVLSTLRRGKVKNRRNYYNRHDNDEKMN